MAPLRVNDMNGIVFDGDIRTYGLMSFGTMDGQPSEQELADLRAYLGRVEAADAQRGPLDVELVADAGAEEQARALEAEIVADLRALGREMQTAIQPWITEWEQRGIFGAFVSFIEGIRDGAVAWWEGEGEFWSAIGDWFANLPELASEAWDNMSDAARNLWDNRQALLDLLRDLATGEVNAFQAAIDTLRPVFEFVIQGVGDMADLMGDVLDRSAEWAQGMHELIRRTDVLPILSAVAVGTLAAIPPNFWSEMAGRTMGFLIPEAIIAILLILLAAFTGGTGSPALAMRLATFAAGIKQRIASIGRAGVYFVRLLDALGSLWRRIADLIDRLMTSRRQSARGQTDVEIPIARRVGLMDEIDPGCFNAARYARERAPNDLAEQRRIMSEYERQLRDQQAGLRDMTVGEYLDSRAAYDQLGRSGVSDGTAQEAARATLRSRIESSVEASLERRGLDPVEAQDLAVIQAEEIMSNLAALHNPDMIAGGQDIIGRVSDSGINSSIGGSWGSPARETSRIGQLDAAARRAAADPNVGRDARMNVRLQPCRGR